MSDKDGGPAFPGEQGHCPDGTWNQTWNPGMTLRQYYAGQALAGYRAYKPDVNSQLCTTLCVADADALIAELAKEPEQ